MSGDLMSLRALLVCASAPESDLFRQGAALAALPLELDDADSVGKACAQIERGGIDFVMIDSAYGGADRAKIVTAARAGGKPPLIILLGADADTSGADAVTAKPRDPREAARLLDRCARSRLPCRVLVIDDSSTMRNIVRKILSATRFPVETVDAEEGEAGLVIARQGGVDVVFLDYNMPGMDGLAALAEFKRIDPGIDVIMMTSTQDKEVADRAIHTGAAAFLKKPFFPSDVDAVLYARCGLVPCKAAANPAASIA